MQMTSTSVHPDDETLAAYVDGTLPSPRRKEVTEHLASCEDCYEIFAETARFLRDEEARPGEVVPFTRRGVQMPARAWFAVAAVLVVALVGAWLLLRGGTGPTAPLLASSGELLALLDDEARAAVATHVWDERSDASSYSGLSLDTRAFFLGVHLVDAQAALEADDEETARQSLDRLAEILMDSPDTDLSGAASDLAREPNLRDLTALERRLAGEVPTDRLALGRFIETARLAAAAGSEEFFARPEVQEAFVRASQGDLSEPTRRELTTARTATDLEEVEAALADVIRLVEVER